MKNQNSQFGILTTGGDEPLMYWGSIVHADDSTTILAQHEFESQGASASQYLLISQTYHNKVARYDNLKDFKIAYHQIRPDCCHQSTDSIERCIAAGKGPYTGPTLTVDEMRSIPYLDLYQDYLRIDHEDKFDYYLYFYLRPDEYIPIHDPEIEDVHHSLQDNPALVERCVDAIRIAGDRYAHNARKKVANHKYLGKRFLRVDTFQSVVELQVREYDPDEDRYYCQDVTAALVGIDRECSADGYMARLACDGHAQDKLRQIKAAIQHLNKPDSASGTDHLNTL